MEPAGLSSGSGGSKDSVQCGDYAYSRQDSLGHGSFAEVFKGHRISDKQPVAIKEIKKSRLRSQSTRRVLESEMAILKGMDHENVVRLLDSQETADHICLVLEFCNGGDLSTYLIDEAPLSESSIFDLVSQIAEALRYLRDRNVVHRDLKPHNILLHFRSQGDLPRIKIADFGFARELVSEDLAATFCGSPLYMAPEILEGGAYNAKADLWSVGIILYQCLTGSAPFQAESLQALQKIFRRKRLDIRLPAVSTELDNLVRSLMQPDPSRRLSFDDFFSHPFLARHRQDSFLHSLDKSSTSRASSNSQMQHDATPGETRDVDDRSYVMIDKQYVELDALTDAVAHAKQPQHPSASGGAVAQIAAVMQKALDDFVPPLGDRFRAGRGAPPTATALAAAAAAKHPAPSSQSLKEFKAKIKGILQPASLIMMVAQHQLRMGPADNVSSSSNISSNLAGTCGSSSGLFNPASPNNSSSSNISGAAADAGNHTPISPTGTSDTSHLLHSMAQRAAALEIYACALSVFRCGMGELRAATQSQPRLFIDAQDMLEQLRKKFKDCLSRIEELRTALHDAEKKLMSPSVLAKGPQVPSAEECIYQHALRLCRDAAGDEAIFSLEAAEVQYQKALVLFHFLISRAQGKDAKVLEQWVASTRRRLQIVSAQSQARAQATHARQTTATTPAGVNILATVQRHSPVSFAQSELPIVSGQAPVAPSATNPNAFVHMQQQPFLYHQQPQQDYHPPQAYHDGSGAAIHAQLMLGSPPEHRVAMHHQHSPAAAVGIPTHFPSYGSPASAESGQIMMGASPSALSPPQHQVWPGGFQRSPPQGQLAYHHQNHQLEGQHFSSPQTPMSPHQPGSHERFDSRARSSSNLSNEYRPRTGSQASIGSSGGGMPVPVMNFCPNCAARFGEFDAHCSNCGVQRQGALPVSGSGTPSPSHPSL